MRLANDIRTLGSYESGNEFGYRTLSSEPKQCSTCLLWITHGSFGTCIETRELRDATNICGKHRVKEAVQL
jgi:hypothetical protein